MGELRMTPARLALLRAVADSQIVFYPGWGGRGDRSAHQGVHGKTVTAAVMELYRAGLVARRGPGRSFYETRLWYPTDAGRAILDGAS
ncbi:MAG TPA: hypothetical protein VF174_15760 [Micromonosporaceae bacterium]